MNEITALMIWVFGWWCNMGVMLCTVNM